MATPTRSQAVSTPKSHLPSTPNRAVASPRPGTGTVAHKSLAGKSPAVKTPASTHGHGHSVSITSHPSSTPMAAATIQDELLNLNSPAAALMNSMTGTGLTPLENGQDGLGMTSQTRTVSQGTTQTTKNLSEERRDRLQQVTDLLKAKAVGRGITREGVERVARLAGFEALWDENILIIAGNIVEIDLTFNSLQTDTVNDLVLKFNPTEGEPQIQEEATEKLKQQLDASSLSKERSQHDSLQDFADNLTYLAQMDRISTTPSSFDVIGSLYQSFSSIWAEEKKRLSWRDDFQHSCKGSIGRPRMNHGRRLGLSVDYWAEKHDLQEVDSPVSQNKIFTAQLSCGVGTPSIATPLKWVTESIFPERKGDEERPETIKHPLLPDWYDSTTDLTTTQPEANGEDRMNVDEKLNNVPRLLDMHFQCELASEVLMPMNVAVRLNSESRMIDIDQTKAVTYHSALQNRRNVITTSATESAIDAKWTRRLPCVSDNGALEHRFHSYALYSASSTTDLWCYPVTQIRFNHPRHLANFLSLCRQSVVVWSLLHSLIIQPAPKEKTENLQQIPKKVKVRTRSNKKPGSKIGKVMTKDDHLEKTTAIDVSLDLLSDNDRAKMAFFVPSKGGATGVSLGRFISVNINVELDGVISVENVAGLPEDGSLKDKLARMLSTTEDVGVVLQWLLEQVESKE